MKRRALLAEAMLVALSAPVSVIAQPAARKPRIAFLGGSLGPTDPGVLRTMVDPFRQGLRELGVVDDPVAEGLASSLAWPGGNFTGLASSVGPEMLVKRLQALKEIVPSARRFGMLLNPDTAARAPVEALVGAFEKALDATLRLYEARAAEEFEAVFASVARDRIDGLVIFADATFYAQRCGAAAQRAAARGRGDPVKRLASAIAALQRPHGQGIA